MATPYLLLELVLAPRDAGRGEPLPSTAYRLTGAYAVEMEEDLRRRASHRLTLVDLPAEGAETFATERELVSRVLRLVEGAGCLVTSRGRQLEQPVLETLALRYGLSLRGHFPIDEPYAARRSPYNPSGHLDLSFFLADGDRRLRNVRPEVLCSLAYPSAGAPAPGSNADALSNARTRALATYLLFLKVSISRGRLSAEAAGQRLAALARGLSGSERSWIEACAPIPPPSTAESHLDRTGPEGALAFDIETTVDFEALTRSLGQPVDAASLPASLETLFGTRTDFPPAPFHRVVAIAMVFWNGREDLELERLVLGGTTRAGAALTDEAALLTTFWRVAKAKQLVSYNGKRFDLPVLLYRSLPHGIDCGWYLEEQRPAYEQYRHPQSLHQIDLFEQLTGGLSPGRLGELLQSVGLPGKQGTSGGDVEALWASGAREAIGDYCLSDAAQTFLLGLRFMKVSGRLSADEAASATRLARARMELEPALRQILDEGTSFFEAS